MENNKPATEKQISKLVYLIERGAGSEKLTAFYRSIPPHNERYRDLRGDYRRMILGDAISKMNVKTASCLIEHILEGDEDMAVDYLKQLL